MVIGFIEFCPFLHTDKNGISIKYDSFLIDVYAMCLRELKILILSLSYRAFFYSNEMRISNFPHCQTMSFL